MFGTMRLLSAILVSAAVIWSLVSYGLFALARSGAAAVTRIEDLLGLEPLSMQWLADSMALVGPAMQVIVAIVWILGLLGLMALGVLLPRLARESVDVARAVRAGERPHLDPEVTKPFQR